MADINTKTNHYRSLDGLRAYSAICIVLMHVLTNGKYALSGFVFEQIIPSFTNLVFLFMTVSAFSMCCGYYKKIIEKSITVEEFYSKRYKKILPFFAVLCALDLIVSPSIDSIYEVFANLTLCFGLLPDANIKVIGVGWFLGLIFVFYIVFPFFCYLLSDKRRAVITFICAFLFNILCELRFDAGRSNIIYSAVFFVAGGIVYLCKDKIENLSVIYKIIVLMLCVAVAVGYFLLGAYTPIILVFCILVLIYAISSRSKFFGNRFTAFISNISMEIYLSHMIVYRILEKLKITQIFDQDILSYIFTAAITIVGTVILSLAVRKALQFAEKIGKKIFYDRKFAK